MRIVSVQGKPEYRGGGELVTAWILEALAGEHEVTVVGWREPDWEVFNRFSGTSLSSERIGFMPLPRGFDVAYRLARRAGLDRHEWQRFSGLMRAVRPIVKPFDLALSPCDEFDFGEFGLQYVHNLWLPAVLGWDADSGGPVSQPARRPPWAVVAGLSVERVRANSTAVNSEHTARIVRERLGARPRVIHPPAPGHFPDRPWSAREDRVVMIGRMIRYKRFDLALEVIRRARAAGAELGLVVLGGSWGVRPDELAAVERLLASEPWVDLHRDLPRDRIGTMVSRCRYGIHAAPGEPYGIAVAEMVRSGCIPLTRRSGGPPEITGGDPRLLFDSAEEAAERLLRLMRSPGDRDELRARLRRRAAILEPEAFMSRIRDWVARGAEARANGAGDRSAAEPTRWRAPPP